MNTETDRLYAAVENCALTHQSFTVDQVFDMYESLHSQQPESRRQVGGALISCVFAGLIEDTGQWESTGTQLGYKRGKPKRIWRSKVYEGA